MILSTKNLRKSFRSKTVVDGVDIQIKKGDVVGLLGPNGAGKTTTFYIIMGFLKPDEGYVYLDDIDITNLPMHKKARLGISYLPQEASIFRGLTVEDNIYAVCEMIMKDKNEMKETTERLLEEFNLKGIRKALGGKLSGGERRRVEIARALVAKPHFLLLDEPFTGIDPIVREEIQKLVLTLKNKNIGILITDHNVRETLEITDFSYIMYEGKILISGRTEELIKNDEARRIYLGEKFRI
uniref:LPS export ABC transporter ATP-binding protein n=1 Tax=candidate division WOR-3 bacterium TaxID=2052148 RepID=A0A7C4YGT2_UNCW3